MATIVSSGFVVRLPVQRDCYQGIWSWMTTVDAKRIGILSGATAIFFFIVGGLQTTPMRMPRHGQRWSSHS